MNNTSASANPAAMNVGLLFVRLACSLPLLYHGSQILFGSFGGLGPRTFAEYQHLPVVCGYLVGLAQFASGLALLLGAFLRVGAVCVIIVMIGAIFRVHIGHGYDIANGGMEFALAVLLMALGLLFTGAGGYSMRGALPKALRTL